jgi:hypothetical protein
MNLEFLEALREDWKPVSKSAAIGWSVFYGIFILYAIRARGGFLLIDHVNLVIHEGGHLLFGFLGSTMSLWGGTLLELMVPLALAVYFTFDRHPTGAAFSSFFFFQNFLYIGTYMADARSQGLPLVTVGDVGEDFHDWFQIFSSLGLLQYDRTIGGLTRALGWLGLLATIGWLLYRWRRSAR